MNFLSASLSWRNATDRLGSQASISNDLLEASNNCGAIATLSTFLNSATLWSGLLGRIPPLHSTWGASHDHRSLDTEWQNNGYQRSLCHQRRPYSYCQPSRHQRRACYG